MGGHELSPSERVKSDARVKSVSKASEYQPPAKNRIPILTHTLHPRYRGLDKLVRGRSSSKTSPPVPLAGSREDGGAINRDGNSLGDSKNLSLVITDTLTRNNAWA